MLKVNADGVQLLLKHQVSSNTIWRDILLVGVLFAINAILDFYLGLYSRNITFIINFMIMLLAAVLNHYRKRHQSTYLSGGDLVLSSSAFTHTSLGKTTQYQLTQFDHIKVIGDTLQIANNHKILYHIQGFHDPKHIQIAQAVLQGKPIKTQGKAIKLQSS